jgi:hypothetical protein
MLNNCSEANIVDWLVERFGDKFKLKLTPSFLVVKTIGGLSQIKNVMKDVIECALHDFAFSYMNSSEVIQLI